jgi:hypothetical protein
MNARRAHRSSLVCVAVAIVASACGPRRTPRVESPSLVHPVAGVPIARIGNETITDVEVQTVARTEGIRDPRAALDRAIELRLLAREALRRGLDRDPLVTDLARRAEIQALLAHTIEAEHRLDNLPADDLRAGMRLRGFNLAHGELWRTIHALVMVPHDATPARRAELRARAEALHAALAALPPPRLDAFRATATASLRGVPSRIEDLPGIDREGRFAQGDMAPAFTAAAVQLEHPGEISPVVETEFGYHVIMLVAREPPLERPLEEVRAIVSQELLWRVQHRALDGLLDRLREQYHATIHDAALRMVETVPIAADSNAPRGGT